MTYSQFVNQNIATFELKEPFLIVNVNTEEEVLEIVLSHRVA